VSLPPPSRHTPGGPRVGPPGPRGASWAAGQQGQTAHKPALRRALRDREAAEVAAGYPKFYHCDVFNHFPCDLWHNNY